MIGPPYPTNANGMTYGSGLSPGKGPDLVAAYGTQGQLGYVRRSDLAGPMPTSLVTTGVFGRPHSIPLYARTALPGSAGTGSVEELQWSHPTDSGSARSYRCPLALMPMSALPARLDAPACAR